MERLLKQELRKKKDDFNENMFFGRQQNDNTQNKIIDNLVDQFDDVTILKYWQWMQQEERELLDSCLNNLGLYEKQGLDGQGFLHPIKKKERKLNGY